MAAKSAAVEENVNANERTHHHLADFVNETTNSMALVTIIQQKDEADGQPRCGDESSPGDRKVLQAEFLESGFFSRDVILAKLNQEKIISLIRAWEENVKATSTNRYNMKVAKISAWETARKAATEAKLKQLEAKLEHQRASYEEEIKNKIALVHKKAENKRAIAKARHGKEIIKAEETSAQYRASGKSPRKWSLWLHS